MTAPSQGTPDLPALQRARRLWLQDEREDAYEEFTRAVEAHPENLRALIDTARAAGQLHRYDHLRRLLDQLVALAPADPDLQFLAGQSYRMSGRPREAEAHLRAAIEQAPEHFGAHLELAILLERDGELEGAANHARNASRLSPKLAEPRVVLGKVLRRQGDVKGAIRMLTAAARQKGASPDARAMAFATLAKIRTAEGRHADGLRLALTGKTALQPSAAPLVGDAEKKSVEIASLPDSLSPEHFEKWAGLARETGESAPCLMTSFPRSGTTLLGAMLDAHPGILAADEHTVFPSLVIPSMIAACGGTPAEGGERLDGLDPGDLKTWRARYFEAHEATAGEALNGRLLIDKNPALTLFIPFFLRLFPGARIIVPLRDPRDVILSCLFEYFPLNPNSLAYLQLDTAVRRICLDLGIWLRLREMLPDDCWHETRYEDLVTDPETCLRDLTTFLGLAAEPAMLDYHRTADSARRIPNAPTYAEVSKPPHQNSVARWRHHEGLFEPHREDIEPLLTDLGYSW